MSKPRAILIAGPTGSGKSALALDLAERLQGTIINADSMQVYSDLRILTARPSENDEARIPHALFGTVNAAETYSVGHYVEDVADALVVAAAAKRIPIIVGGTGLYFHALTEGLSPIPAIPDEIRNYWRRQAQDLPPGHLHIELSKRDAEMARRLPAADSQRIVRALEVIEATGRSLSSWQQDKGSSILSGYSVYPYVISWSRGALYARIDARFALMFGGGACEEVSALNASGIPHSALIRKALGVSPITRFLAGRLSREAAIDEGQLQTRQYAKRQLTWLRSRMKSWNQVQFSDSCFDVTSQLKDIVRMVDHDRDHA